MGKDRTDAVLTLGSLTSAFGLALGELLVALGKPDDLGRCLADIHTAAQGTILSLGPALSGTRGQEEG